MNLDGSAGVQYRIGQSQLNSELYRIAREEKAEMRMHNTMKQRFLAKFTNRKKMEPTIEASDVKMYETHNPGFCYRRNGECRAMQGSSQSPSLDFKNIHGLLFTDGQVDIEKVLCLHLLSAHKTETLKPPTGHHADLSYVPREQRPVERLIERSKKKRNVDESLTKLLPVYVLEFGKPKSEDSETTLTESEILIRDGRLAARIIINDKIQQLVHTVLSALQFTNPEKMSDLVTLAHTPEQISSILEKPHIQRFIRNLNGQLLIYSCESFHLTQPFKMTATPLHINSKSKQLSNLVCNIRKNVLQLPTHSTWKSMYDQAQVEQTRLIGVGGKGSNIHQTVGNEEVVDKENKPPAGTGIEDNTDIDISVNVQSSKSSKEEIDSRKLLLSKRSRGAKPKKSQTSTSKSSTSGSVNAKKNLPKYLEYLNEPPVSRSGSRSNERSRINENSVREIGIKELYEDSEKPANIPDLTNAQSMEVDEINSKGIEPQSSDTSNAKSVKPVDDSNSPPINPSMDTKVSVTQLKRLLPTAHAHVTAKKATAPQNLSDENAESMKSLSGQKLTEMIDKRIMGLKNERKKAQAREMVKPMPPSRYYKSPRGRRYSVFDSQVDSVDLDIIDLAKINQEIREKETQKKLTEFLSTKI